MAVEATEVAPMVAEVATAAPTAGRDAPVRVVGATAAAGSVEAAAAAGLMEGVDTAEVTRAAAARAAAAAAAVAVAGVAATAVAAGLTAGAAELAEEVTAVAPLQCSRRPTSRCL